MLKKPIRFLATSLLIAWAFDLLFWQKSPGISFALYTTILVTAGFYFARVEGRPPARNSLWLLIPIGGFALITTTRLEPMTVFTSIIIIIGLMMILAHTFGGGRWTNYSLSDYVALSLRLFKAAIVLAPDLFRQIRKNRGENETLSRGASLRSLRAILLGLFLAFPIVLTFAALLSSADPIFADRLEEIFRFFNLEQLIEYGFRGFYIAVLAYVLIGIYLYALTSSQNETLLGVEKPILNPFLGSIEALIILGSVNVLFFGFVIVQFQYFFGGSSNITYEGFTYAEYARRGFGELVVVALFSLLLFLSLSSLTRREKIRERKIYSGMGVLLGLLISIILVSAFQRLLLYENTFGFTRLRTYPHIFMIWLGILLVAFILLEITGRQRTFGMALLAIAIGFGLTLGLLNIDGFIVRENVARAKKGSALDTDYLLTLSLDSTPILVDVFTSSGLSQALHDEVGVVLACQAAELRQETAEQSWTGLHISKWRARRLLAEIEPELRDYIVIESWEGIAVEFAGEERLCEGKWWLD